MKHLESLSATQAARLLARREIKAEDLLLACLDRIGSRESKVHAWVSLGKEKALLRAKELDKGAVKGLLHGLPIGVKDLYDTYDLPTTYGSPIYKDNRPKNDAVAVALMRHEGGVILGKTVTTEFATFKPGPTCNPHKLNHTPGGSSSGSAAAVADRMVPLATGSQTAGSIIRPASFCGVVGYKPSYGKISISGVKGMSNSLDTLGVFGKTVSDAALGVAAMSGDHDLLKISKLDNRPRMAICKTGDWGQAQKETAAALSLAAFAANAFASNKVKDITIPKACSQFSKIQTRIMQFDIAKSFTFENTHYSKLISPELKQIINEGNAISYKDYSEALIQAQIARQAIGQLLVDDVDVLIAPSAIGEAPASIGKTGDPIFCRGWTLMGLPCINLTITSGPSGLPVGVQLIAGLGRDRYLLSVAYALARELSDPLALHQA